MKVLFVGPYPPPHGGISVHVWSAHALMKRAGEQSNVLNVDPRAPESNEYIKVSGAVDLLRELVRHAWNDWFLNVHTNGHNRKSWIISLASGLAAQFGPGGSLTLHSGLAPGYIKDGSEWRKRFVRFTCLLFNRIVCVNEEIADAIASLGISRRQIEISPAYLPMDAPHVAVPEEIETWLNRHSPVLSSTMFFRPEYGFDVLVEGLVRLKNQHAQLGCVVMGGTENRSEAIALLQQHGLEENVYLAGDLDHELCLELMARSDAYVRPTYRDGDSISVREAISLGVPVVASNVGTRPEGTLLFQAGNVDGLMQQLNHLLGNA